MSETNPTYTEFLAEKAAGKLVICGTCRIPLNTFTEVDTGDFTYTHSQAYRSHDHEPVPIAVDPAGEGIASDCDFCGSRREMHWSFLGKIVQIDHPPLVDGNIDFSRTATNDYGDRWAACKECGEAINNKDYGELMRLCQSRSQVVRRMAKANKKDGLETLLESFSLLWGQYLPSIYQRDYIGPRHEATRLSPRLLPKVQTALMSFWSTKAYDIAERLSHTSVYGIPGVHSGREDLFSTFYPPDVPVPPQVWKNHFNHLSAGIGVSNLYWISPKFTQLAIMAGKDFEKLSITREELPSTFGLMVFEEPIGLVTGDSAPDHHIRAVSWTLVPDGVWINMYIQPEENARSDYDIIGNRAQHGYLMPTSFGGGMQFGEDQGIDEDRPDDNPDFVATILATWFLLAQPGVAEVSIAPVDKKYLRAYQRQYGRKPADVQVVDLRKPPVRSHGGHESGPRGPLTVRVFRRGHWKQQAYGPKRGMRKTIYISPYIAGPANAPLKQTRPTVRVLR